MASPSAVVFDYYETLAVLSVPTRERLFDDLARRVALDLPPGEAYRHWRELIASDFQVRFGGRPPPLDGATAPFYLFREIWLERSRQLFEKWGVDVPAEVGGDAFVDMHARAALYPDAAPALAALRKRYRLAVLSDADNDFLKPNLERNGLSFEAVVTSEDLRVYKPHVSLFREVCARLGVQPSAAVHVGDNPRADVEGARHAGMRPVWINRHDAPWPEQIEPPPATIRSLDELPAVLEAPA